MSHDFWYLSRSAGFTAYGLLFVSTALGILIGTRLTGRFSRASLFDIHRFTAFLALGFSLLHVALLLGDAYFNFTIADLAIPFASPYRAWQTAAGVFALYLTAIIIASFYVRRITGYRLWRAIHFATFFLFGLATLHGVTAGSDTSTTWARAIYFVAGVSTLSLIIYRVQHQFPLEAAARRMRYAAGATATVAAVTLMLATGIVVPSSNDEGTATTAVADEADTEAPGATFQESVNALLAARGVQIQFGDYDDDDDREHEERPTRDSDDEQREHDDD